MRKKDLLNKLMEENKHMEEKLNSNSFTIDELRDRLEMLPKKIYRYRPGSKWDFDALENEYLWFSQPKDCDDKIDYTVKYSLAKQIPGFKKMIQKHFDKFVLDFIRNAVPYEIELPSEETVKSIREFCFDEKGNFLTDKTQQYLQNIEHSELYNPIIITMEKLKGYMKENSEDLNRLANNLIDVANSLNEHTREHSMVCCFAENHKIGSLWSKYAKEYSGFCIEYDLTEYENMSIDEKNKMFYLFPIIYGNRKEFNMVNLFEDAIVEHVFKSKPEHLFDEQQQLEMNRQLLTKEKSWSDQKEWRFVLKYNNNNRQNFSLAKAIYMGCKISDRKKNRIIKIAKKKNYRVYQQVLNESKSELTYKKVEIK